jgi:hypothetical protein
MVSPIGGRYPMAPIAPYERDVLTDADWNAVRSWIYQLSGFPPSEENFARLYAQGKRAGIAAAWRDAERGAGSSSQEPTR